MGIQHDSLRVQYDEIDAIDKAQEEDIISEEEGTALKLTRTNAIRVLLGLGPAE